MEFPRGNEALRRAKRNPCKGGIRTSPDARRKRSGGRGFTIIEVAITVAIIGIMAVIAGSFYQSYIFRSRINLAISHIRLLEQAIAIYQFENATLPDNLSQVKPAPTETLPSLDPWSNPYQYLNLGTEPPGMPNARRDGKDKPLSLDYDLYSMGADGVTHKKLNHAKSLDDVVRARTGAFVDLASKY